MEQSLQTLLDRYFRGELSPEERRQLAMLMREPGNQLYLTTLVDEQLNDDTRPLLGDLLTGERILGGILRKIDTPVRTMKPLRKWGWVAAAVLLAAVSVFIWMQQQRPAPATVVQQANVVPGRNGAVLTLADNTQVSLDTIQNGTIALQGGAVAKVVNGSLVYENNGYEVVYNTMHTPNGRQFQVTLPDGTNVWLNAASSIRYPTLFKNGERKVEITGEAYFEVAQNKAMPFRVNVNNKAEVEVLGTHFNINAYENEAGIDATLLEGAVRVKDGSGSLVLKPGQQARIRDSIQLVPQADLSGVMAWKNGYFNFEGQPLRVVMRQLERWYDIRVVYQGDIQDIIFRGKIFRSLQLGDVLYILQKMGVKFKMEGRTLTVTA